MAPWKESAFCITGPLPGESTGHQWVPPIKANDAELCCFFLSAPEQTVEQTIGNAVAWSAPNHYLNQYLCWNVVNSNLRNKLQQNLKRNWYTFVQENVFKYDSWKISVIFSWPQCVKSAYQSMETVTFTVWQTTIWWLIPNIFLFCLIVCPICGLIPFFWCHILKRNTCRVCCIAPLWSLPITLTSVSI